MIFNILCVLKTVLQANIWPSVEQKCNFSTRIFGATGVSGHFCFWYLSSCLDLEVPGRYDCSLTEYEQCAGKPWREPEDVPEHTEGAFVTSDQVMTSLTMVWWNCTHTRGAITRNHFQFPYLKTEAECGQCRHHEPGADEKCSLVRLCHLHRSWSWKLPFWHVELRGLMMSHGNYEMWNDEVTKLNMAGSNMRRSRLGQKAGLDLE